MLTENMILEWKEAYEEIYSVTILEQEFIFRLIGREEYKNLSLAYEDISDMQEAICYITVLHPRPYNFTDNVAGIAETISNFVIEFSGLAEGQLRQILEYERENMTIFDYQADAIIHEAFPEYSLETIQSWPAKKLVYYLARAEWILVNLRGVPLVSLDNQEDQEQYQEEVYAPAPAPKEQAPQKPGQLSQEEVERMLSEAEGRQIDLGKSTTMQDAFPELKWFQGENELTGGIG